MSVPGAVDLVVAMFAHNESSLITDCLGSVSWALQPAPVVGVVRRGRHRGHPVGHRRDRAAR